MPGHRLLQQHCVLEAENNQVTENLKMASNNFDPGGGERPPSYANRVKTSARKHKKLDRNVLNIIIEKKNLNEHILLKGDQVAQICDSVGLRVSSETEGYQVVYSGKVITLSVWAKPPVSLERFMSDQPREINSQLIITSVKPAVRREVSVLVTGLHFNTPDEQVRE